MKKIKLVFLGVLALGLFVTSCDKEKEENITNLSHLESSAIEIQDLRQQLADGTIHFVQLTEQQKLSVTEDKINQILTNSLPTEVESKLNLMLIEIPKFYNNQSNTVSDIGVELAGLIPEQDFYLMFYDFSDYSYNGSYIDNINVSQEILDEIVGMTYNAGIVQEKPTKQLYCDCGWTCGISNPNCIKTFSGCGFLWGSGCSYIDLVN